MDDATEDEAFQCLKGPVQVFLHHCKTIAATFEKPPSHTSKPVTVDENRVTNLKLKLEAIRLTLSKADGLSLSDEVDRLWMRELRDLEYWLEDVLEQIQFEYFRGKRFQEIKEELLGKSVGKRKREMCNLFPAVQSKQLLEKIKRITDRFQEIDKDRKALNLRKQDGARLAQPSPRTPTSSFPTRQQLQGRARDMNKLVNLLSTDDASNGSLYSVIPIVGMAGVGKTHLVQHAYQTIDSGFNLKIWVSVSQQCDIVEVTRRIVDCIEKESSNLSQLDPLQSRLSDLLRDKKFLLVLDDVYEEDQENWERLRVPFNCGAKGSRVIVTTKSMKVSQMMCLKMLYLGCLSEDDSWGICSERVNKHYGNEFNLDFNMIDIGKKLAARCKGLPLAAQAVGEALSLELNEKHWNSVLENYLLTDDKTVRNILPALRVSYDYLPLHLKYCFAYCSLFPKGYIFEQNKVVQLWMAQGFIHPDRSCGLEEAGCSYFDDLAERCFFQHSPSHYPSEGKYVMHDLYHELAETVSGIQYNRTEDHKIQKLDDSVRHSSMVPQESNSKEAIQLSSFGRRDLRTFLLVKENMDKPERVHLSMDIRQDPFSLLECLRVLDLSNTDIKNLPRTIGRLIHLRYLSVESTKITILPESIIGLFNLQTLNLKHCCDLEELPMGMKLMDKLRHLYLPLGANCSLSMPAGMGLMTSLQTLPLIAVKIETGGCGVEELGSLENLKGELHISEMNNVTDMNFAEQANMQKKSKLQKLTLEWSNSPDSLEEPVLEVLEKLKPHSNLEEFIIKGFCGNRFPSWLGDEYLLKLDTLEIKNCRNVQELPSLGCLPSLKYLFIQSLSKLRSVGPEFCGHASSSSSNPCIVAFPKLETLVLKKMDALEEWVGVEKGDFPRMKSLTFNRCEKVHTAPEFPTSDNVKETNPVIKWLPSKKAHDCPLLVLSDCGSKFEEMQIPNNQVQAINNTKSTDSNDVEMIESGSISGKTVIQVQEMQAPNIEVQTSNIARCSDSNDVNMVESGNKIQEANIQVKEIQTPNSQVQAKSNYTPCLCSDDVITESGSNTLDKTVACFQDKQKSTAEDKQKNIAKGSPSDVYHTNYKVADSPICGREEDANRIIEILLSDKSGERNVNFMCVVAPSGVGKTTIIHHVFNKHTISEAFDTMVWVRIREVHDEKALMKEIIESITHLSCVRADLSLLHEIVQEELSGKKFLLILDGAENENLIDWSSVCTVLNVGPKGSMVVVATKSRVVADAINSEHCHFLDNLSDHTCWSIFWSLNPKFPSSLRERCKHLVEKCEGIPLCVKMIGGCFHNAMTEERIMAVSESKSWETDELGLGILPALRVCYEFLSFELRKCFAYCALFPKDHVFVKDHIVRLWMSQGFIDHSGVEKLEEIGVQYFDELVSRSFLQVSPIHDEKDGKFLMHELVHDLAECITFNECLRSEDCSQSALENVSHLALAPYEVKNVKLSMVTEKITNLETFMVLNRFTPQLYNLISSPIANLSGLKDFLEKHRHIKTLDLSDTDIDMLPESIILLESLQFLGINNTKVKNIPPEICTHGKLQTLEARNCCNLVELPANLKELTSLQHLDTRKESGFVTIPSGIRYLTNLRTLSSFNVGNGESHSSIKELKNLKHLKGEIRITGLENIESGNEAKETELERKKSLKILVLEWCGGRSGEKTEEFSKQVLGYLQPPSNLQEIVIRNYTGTQFPLWVENHLFPNLVSITLDNCFNCDKFPNFGNLPSLKHLCAQKMHLVKNLGEQASSSRSTKDPKFLSLEVLKLSEMHGLKDLFQIENMDFPRLYSLSINRCPMLGKIPRFASLVELSVSCCTELPDISDLSSVEFLKIDRVENLDVLVVWKLNMLKKLEISNCGELKSVQYLSDQPLTVKAKCFRCPKLTLPKNWKNVSIEKELEVRDSSKDSESSSGQQNEESDDYLSEDY